MNNIKSEKGITLVALVITIVIMLIMTTTIAVNASLYVEKRDLTNMQTDLRRLEEEVELYFAREKELPVINKYTDVSMLQDIENTNDGVTFYVIDIRKLNVELKYGQDIEKVIEKNRDTIVTAEDELQNIYIINERTHTVYYPKGIKYDGITYYKLKNDFETVDGIAYKYIYNKEQLVEFKNRVNNGETFENTEVVLMNNIDLGGDENDDTTWWTPIGNGRNAFKGTFDGKNHTISGIYNKPTSGYKDLGFFGSIWNATIKNLTLKGDIIAIANTDSYTANAGGFTSQAYGKVLIENCVNEVNVTKLSANKEVGGFCAASWYSTSVTTEEKSLTLRNCTNKAKIQGSNSCGGLIGAAVGKVNIENCINEGIVLNDQGNFAGGFIGRDVSSTDIPGYTYERVITITDSCNKGNITGIKHAGGMISQIATSKLIIKNSGNEGIIDAQNYGAGCVSYVVNTCTGPLQIENYTNRNNVTANLYEVGGCIGFIAQCTQLDISISNFINDGVITANTTRSGGIIGQINGIRTLDIIECNNNNRIIAEKDASGCIAYIGSIQNGTITINNYNNNNIVTSNTNAAGGCVGFIGGVANSNLNIINSSNNGNITGLNMAGGIIGKVNECTCNIKINECINNTNVTINGKDAGGCIGTFGSTILSTINNFKNSGNVEGKFRVGGCIGEQNSNTNLTITNSSNSATIIQTNTSDSNGYAYVGGIVGNAEKNSNLIIINCSNTNSISSADWNAGGIIGETKATTTKVINSYNSGAITGKRSAGGLAAMLNGGSDSYTPSIEVYNFYQKGTLTSEQVTSAIFRRNSVSNIRVENSYYLNTSSANSIENSANTDINNSISKTDNELKSAGFLQTLNSYVTSNPAYTIDVNSIVTLKGWKAGTDTYPTFQ